MGKENGRLSPKTDLETSAFRDIKIYVCTQCGKKFDILEPEFGKEYMCDVCETFTLTEDV